MFATKETVRWCWKNLLEGDVDCEGYTPEYFSLSKMHPSFNDDTVISWFLLRHMKRTGAKSMKEAFPSLEEWVNELNTFDPTLMEEGEPGILTLSEVRPILEEIYYGADFCAECKAKSRGIPGDGYWGIEKPAIERHWKDFALPVGIYTGRTCTEMILAKRHLNWPDFPNEMMITADDGIVKPSPLGFSILCEWAGARTPIFFGDTISDKEALRAFAHGIFVAIGPILKDDAMRGGIPHFDTLGKAVQELL